MTNKKIILTGMLLSIASGVSAQVGEIAADPWLGSGSRFFISIVAGVLLAIAFQIVLTMLSAATGITAVGNIRKAANRPSDEDTSDMSETAGKITTGVGLWTLITVSLSLFFASLLAVKLSLVATNFIGVTLGLVIWAAFFTSMIYLEMRTVTSLAGGLMRTVKNGLGSVFSSSEKSKEVDVAKAGAREHARAMRKEIEKLFDSRHLDKRVDEYVRRLQPQRLNMESIKAEMKDLLTQLEIDERRSVEDGKVVKKLIIEEARGANISKEDLHNLSTSFDELTGIYKKDISKGEKAREAIGKMTGTDPGQMKEYENKIKQYLQAADKEALQPERIEHDINEIFNDPSKAGGIIKEKVAALDHDTLVRMVSSRSDISPEDAEKYTTYVENAIAKISGISTSASREAGILTDEVRARIRNFISMLEEKKEFDLPRIKNDFVHLFNTEDHEGLIYKLEHYNKEQLLDLITTNTSISREKAEPIVSTMVEARDTVVEKAQMLRQKVNEKLEEAKQEALQQAENTRKAAATAAWWMTATAIFSAIASALGGMFALDMF